MGCHARHHRTGSLTNRDRADPLAGVTMTRVARPLQDAEDYHQQYLEKGGQSAMKGSQDPIQCYGNRGPIKKMNSAVIRQVLAGRSSEL